MEGICHQLAMLLAHDPGKRRVPSLSASMPLQAAVSKLLAARRVVLISGFYIGRAGAWETDGPLGSLVLAAALEQAGVAVTICTDSGCLPIFQRGGRLLKLQARFLGYAPNHELGQAELLALQPDALVAIERPGRAADGRYYNAGGFDITAKIAHFDRLVLSAQQLQLPTIAVGDGGNELGFGSRLTEARGLMGLAAPYACATPVDHLIIAGVSNWGAYALAALYARHLGQSSPVDEPLLLAVLQEMVHAGAIDGIAMQRRATVDGLPLAEEQEMFRRVIYCTHGAARTAD